MDELRYCLDDNLANRLYEKLRQIEWVSWDRDGTSFYCPDCIKGDDEGHAPDCGLAALLKEYDSRRVK